MDGNPKPSAYFRWPHLNGSSTTNVTSVQLYPFAYSSTYTMNKINASYCGRILQTTLKNRIGTSSVTAYTNVTVLCKFISNIKNLLMNRAKYCNMHYWEIIVACNLKYYASSTLFYESASYVNYLNLQQPLVSTLT